MKYVQISKGREQLLLCIFFVSLAGQGGAALTQTPLSVANNSQCAEVFGDDRQTNEMLCLGSLSADSDIGCTVGEV